MGRRESCGEAGPGDRHLPAAAYAHAEAHPLYADVWRMQERADLTTILRELSPLAIVRAAFLAARSVESLVEREQPSDRRLPIAIAALGRWLAAGVSDTDLARIRAAAQDSANHWTAEGSSAFVRASFSIMHALTSARKVSEAQCPSIEAMYSLHYAANAVGYNYSPIHGVLAPVVREHLARQWTAAALKSARSHGVRLYGSLEERAVAVDVALSNQRQPV